MCAAKLALHQHGKGRVRLGRTWRRGDVHEFVEFMVHTMLESDMEHAFVRGENTDMTATDTQKNTVRDLLCVVLCSSVHCRLCRRWRHIARTWITTQVYYIAKQFDRPCSPEEFGLALAKHFVKTYPRVCLGVDGCALGAWRLGRHRCQQ